MTPKEFALAHYLGVLADAKDSLNSVDFNRAVEAHRTEAAVIEARQARGWDFPKPEPMHYECPKCDEVFGTDEAEVERWAEPSEAFGVVAHTWHEVPICPFCGSDDLLDYTEAKDEENAL